MSKPRRFVLGCLSLVIFVTFALFVGRAFQTRNLENFGSAIDLISSARFDCEAQVGWVTRGDVIMSRRDFCYEQRIKNGDDEACYYYNETWQIGECLGQTSLTNQSFQCEKSQGNTEEAIRKSCIEYLVNWITYQDSSLLEQPWVGNAFTKQVLSLANGEVLPYAESNPGNGIRIQANAGKLWNCRYPQCDGEIYRLEEFMDCTVPAQQPVRLWGSYNYIFVTSCRLSDFGVEVELMIGNVMDSTP